MYIFTRNYIICSVLNLCLFIFLISKCCLYIADLVLDDSQLRSYAFAEIEQLLQCHGKSMKDDL
jgi:hypothetical protein